MQEREKVVTVQGQAPGTAGSVRMVSRRIRELAPSPTLAMDTRAKELARRGAKVLNLSVGEPDFDTPEHVKEAAIRAIRDGFTKYTPSAGIPELREAVAAKLQRENGLAYAPSEVVICAGGKHVLYNLFQVILDPGDEVIVPVPIWPTFIEQVKLAGGVPVLAPMQADLKLRAADVAACLTPRTRALVLNSPSNPTGVIIEQEELRAIARLAVERGFLLISDETYEHFIYERGMQPSVASFGPDVKALTIVVNTLSKTYGMTGWRVGYAAGPAPIIKGIIDLNSNSTSNATSIAQVAAVAALNGPQDCVQTMIAEFARRRTFLVQGLTELGWSCPTPEGAFYVFPRVPGGDSMAFAERLLNEAHIATVPGAAFYGEGHIRMSYAASMAVLEETLERLRRFPAA